MLSEELNKLLEHSVEYATDLLIETGESYPFGAYIDLVGNVHPLEMEINMKQVPQAEKVIEGLRTYCQQEMAEKRLKAYCLSYEVSIQLSESETTDAIAFEMIHADISEIPGYFLPFTLSSSEGKKSALPGELFAVKQNS